MSANDALPRALSLNVNKNKTADYGRERKNPPESGESQKGNSSEGRKAIAHNGPERGRDGDGDKTVVSQNLVSRHECRWSPGRREGSGERGGEERDQRREKGRIREKGEEGS